MELLELCRLMVFFCFLVLVAWGITLVALWKTWRSAQKAQCVIEDHLLRVRQGSYEFYWPYVPHTSKRYVYMPTRAGRSRVVLASEVRQELLLQQIALRKQIQERFEEVNQT